MNNKATRIYLKFHVVNKNMLHTVTYISRGACTDPAQMAIYKLENLNHNPYADMPELVSDTESSVSSYGGTTSNTEKSTHKTEDTKSNKIEHSEKDHFTQSRSPIVDLQNGNIGVLPNRVAVNNPTSQ
jgi:hypothetical protein